MGRPRRKGQDSPIGNKQKALAEQEEKLRRKMEELQQLIKDAPLLQKEAEKRRKQDLVIRASQPTRPAESPGSLFDMRYDANISNAMPRRRPRASLRAERQAARLKFLALCAVLLLAGLLLYHMLAK
jgi:hypothetical protein